MPLQHQNCRGESFNRDRITLRQLATMELRFEVRSGITLESARNVAELMNDFINALIVTRHPERLATFARR